MTPGRAPGLLLVAAAIIALVDVALLVRASASGTSSGGAPGTAATVPRTGTEPDETLDQQLARVAATVADTRELAFEDVPDPTLLGPDDLAARAAAVLGGYDDEDAELDRRLLAALGAIPDELDLRATLERALSEQVAGFYDPETRELVVGRTADGERLGPLGELTLAHELQHALADQVLGLPDLEGADGDEDAAFAARSLVEGDATYTMVRYARRALSLADQAELLQESALAQADVDALPHVLQRSLTFPYEEGLRFAVTLFQQSGGWAAVDRAYGELPTSSLQILRPDVYLAGQGAGDDPRDPTAPGAPWEVGRELAFGAADLLFLFEAPGDDPDRALDDPDAAAATWEAGQATVWRDGQRTAVGIALQGDPALCDAVRAWYTAAFPDAVTRTAERASTHDGTDQDAVVWCLDPEVRVGIAPDLATAEAVTR